jgi:glycosyltransferase involved in cell wall biosynthesis
MNICLFTDSFLPSVGGMEVAVHHLAENLIKLGHHVCVLAKTIKNMRGPVKHYKHHYVLIRYGYAFPFSGRTGLDFLSSFFTLKRAHTRHKFDVINCHSVSHAGSRAVFAKKKLSLPLVLTPHGEDIQRVPEINYGLRLNKRWDQKIRSNLKKADAVTAISDSIKGEMTFLPQKKIFTVPNGIESDQSDIQKTKFLHGELGIDKSFQIILSVGRNHIKKGYEYGIKAFAVLDKKLKNHNLVYVIVGRDTDKLKPLASELSLNGKVFLLAQKDRASLLKCYQSAWCFFSPSIVEGLSLVGIEAMASGLPLIVTDVPGNIDLVRDNRCGIIVNNKNIDSMAEGVLGLYSDMDLYNRSCQNASERSKRYDWKNVAREYIDVYRIAIRNCNSH